MAGNEAKQARRALGSAAIAPVADRTAYGEGIGSPAGRRLLRGGSEGNEQRAEQGQ
jgi:hypothetical protein